MKKEFIMAFVLPDLPYAFDALEPIIDAKRWRSIMAGIMRLMWQI